MMMRDSMETKFKPNDKLKVFLGMNLN